MPYINGKFIDELLLTKNRAFLLNYTIIVFTTVILGFLLGYIMNIFTIDLQSRVSFEIYKDVLHHVNSISIDKINNMNLAAMNQRISTDINAIVSFTINTLQNMVSKVIVLLFSFYVVFLSNKWFSLLILLCCSLYFVACKLIKSKVYLIKYKHKEQQNKYFAKTHEQYSNVTFVKMQGLNELFIKRLDEPFIDLLKSTINNQKISYLYNGIDIFLYFIMQVTMIILGGNAIMNGQMTIGDFTIINSYLIMSINVIKYFYNLGKYTQDTLVSLDRINEILNILIENNGDIKEENINSIKLCNLSFGYTDDVLLKNLNIEFEKGKVYSIIGLNGTGKSTLLHLLLGIYNSKFTGELLINNTPIHEYDTIYLRMKAIGYLEQNPCIISGSILNNICLDNNECEDEILSIMTMSGISIINNADCHILNNDADNLSGGEKLKLSLIRILKKNPSLLLLDEPSSMLDSSTVDVLVDYLNLIKSDKIIIVVTHDNKLISISDEVIELNK